MVRVHYYFSSQVLMTYKAKNAKASRVYLRPHWPASGGSVFAQLP